LRKEDNCGHQHCRGQAKRVYYNAVLDAKSEIPAEEYLMFPLRRIAVAGLLSMLLTSFGFADTQANKDTQADKAFTKYGATGKGVIVAIMDRGIDYTHPDFRNSNGTTRIKKMWDFSNANSGLGLCDPAQPAPIVYTEAQINAALAPMGVPLAERDAVGHGTVTAGIATGNGSAVKPASAQYAGFAPKADLLIVKVTSEGAPAHGTQPAENFFQGCYNKALDLVTAEAAKLHEPIVGLINAGTQWGPIDGTGAISRQIDLDFGANHPGYIYVEASGDEGNLNNHARSTYNSTGTTFPFTLTAFNVSQIWYTGAAPANITITANDNGQTVTAPPDNSCSFSGDSSIIVCQYDPGQQFYPWQSSGPDRAAWYYIAGHTGTGSITIQSTGSASGTADVYGDASGDLTFTSLLTAGRLTDFSSTLSALVAACYNVRTTWVDINGITEMITNQGGNNALWSGSSGGPTRDGRVPPNGGVDITTPGGNIFAAYGLNTYWETFQFNLIQGGQGYYGRQSATSGASPILLGTVALMLQIDPNLTSDQARGIIHSTALTDTHTGSTPNKLWGSGKLNVLGALDATANLLNTVPGLNTTSLNFGTQTVGTQSASKNISFSNTGTDSLGIGSITLAGTSYVITSNNCGAAVAPGGKCKIAVAFKPTTTGALTGSVTIKAFNSTGPFVVSLTGTGN
jgi:minor extracellular serine protease Vpr